MRSVRPGAVITSKTTTRERTSQLIEDPLFCQRYDFTRDDDLLRVEIWTDPGGGVLAEHVHPKLEERYEVLAGEVTFHVDGKPRRGGIGAAHKIAHRKTSVLGYILHR
jgi:mannose-6-phosphate isomerase-like protein (cupin superfamily)